MNVVKVIFKFSCSTSEDVEQEKSIRCFDWVVNENFYTFFLNEQKDKVISIPVDNVLYVEDFL